MEAGSRPVAHKCCARYGVCNKHHVHAVPDVLLWVTPVTSPTLFQLLDGVVLTLISFFSLFRLC